MTGGTKTVRITVVRHGETDANKERRLQGQIETFLNKNGIKQAKAAGKSLAKVKFDIAIASDMTRAVDTCKYILEENEASSGLSEGDIIQDKRIRERSFGEFENRFLADYEEACKAKGFEVYEYTPEGAETRDSVRQRVKDFFHEVLKDAYKLDEEEPSYLLVTHGGLIKVLFIYLFETLNCQPAPNCQKGDHRRSPRNTTWTQFVVETNKNEILSISCETMFYSDHLDSM